MNRHGDVFVQMFGSERACSSPTPCNTTIHLDLEPYLSGFLIAELGHFDVFDAETFGPVCRPLDGYFVV